MTLWSLKHCRHLPAPLEHPRPSPDPASREPCLYQRTLQHIIKSSSPFFHLKHAETLKRNPTTKKERENARRKEKEEREKSQNSIPLPNSKALVALNHWVKSNWMMQGNIWAIPNPQGILETIILILQFQMQPLTAISELGESFDNFHHHRGSTPHFKGLRVLLADDDVVNRAVTRKLLEKLGCNVTSVPGIQCISSLRSFGTPPFQLVVLDLHMSKMDGFNVAMKIRKLWSGSWPAIVALTASAEDGEWEKCLRSGINGLIRKPAVLQAMREELNRVLHIA